MEMLYIIGYGLVVTVVITFMIAFFSDSEFMEEFRISNEGE